MRYKRRKPFIDWYIWFAWRPVFLHDTEETVWLEPVYRRKLYDDWGYLTSLYMNEIPSEK